MQTDIRENGQIAITLPDRLDSTTTANIWRQLDSLTRKTPPKHLVIQAQQITYCDGAGMALFLGLTLRAQKQNFQITIENLNDEFQQMLDGYTADEFIESPKKRKKISSFEEVGQVTVHFLDDIQTQIAFFGEVIARTAHACIRPLSVRWKDVFLVAEHVGVNAVGIISLIGLLLGLILAFSSAMPLKQFGAEIYVADLVALSMVRVLGPFITAIILAGRTASSFAAEIGTMKVNNEIDAMTTMGIEPVSFLVLPRMIATIVVTPLLAIIANLFSLIGSGLVMLSIGFPLVTYTSHVNSAIDNVDIFSGLFKSLVFGAIVAVVGCQRGLQTASGPSAVGISTTRAVVSTIILIVIAEGIFAVLFYYMGI